MDHSLKFIETGATDWTIVRDEGGKFNIPIVTGSYPVISVIGTSRDGKSTSLNLYSNYLLSKSNKSYFTSFYGWLFETKKKSDASSSPDSSKSSKSIPKISKFAPFQAMQSDEAVTNGINYYTIPDKCLLLDCQGMQLGDGKHDHYLMLLTYLMSNIIVLTVRERLDLQVLSNCMSIFTFLTQVPAEFRKKVKPILLIRIKDFQNIKQLKKNPKYLDELVEKWLSKSGDQYDQIKQAFSDTFDIKVVATTHPHLNEDGDVDIHDKNFMINNPSFLTFCQTLEALSKDLIPSDIMSTPKQLEKLIDSLQKNKEIKWEKLDWYHQSKENELKTYIIKHLTSCPLTEKDKILSSMDGSDKAYTIYENRMKDIMATRTETYNEFKDVTMDIKEEQFGPIFEGYLNIYLECKNKNIELSEKIVLTHYTTFLTQFSKPEFKAHSVNCIIEYYEKNVEIFMKVLNKVDYNVEQKYFEIIKEKRTKLNKVQLNIREKNKEQKNIMNKLMKDFDIVKSTTKHIVDLLDKQFENKMYNVSYTENFTTAKEYIVKQLQNIYENEDKEYFMSERSSHYVVDSIKMVTFDTTSIFTTHINRESVQEFYNREKLRLFTNVGFINGKLNSAFDFSKNIGIDFCYVKCGIFKFLTTKQFYAKYDLDQIKIFIKETLSTNIVTTIGTSHNVLTIEYTLGLKQDSCSTVDVTTIFNQILDRTFGEWIIKFCSGTGLTYSNN